MKKIILLLLITVAFSGAVSAQTFLINQDFSTASGATPPTGWTQNQLYTLNVANDTWRFNNPGGRSVGAPISGTFAIFDGASYSLDALFENVALESPSFNTLGISTVSLSFDYAFQTGTATSGNIEVFNGSIWEQVGIVNASTAATTQTIDISNAARNNCNVRVRFRWSSNDGGWWAIDNIRVFYTGTPNTFDAKVVGFKPLNGACANSAMQFTVDVKNEGTSTIGGFPVVVKVDNGSTVSTITQNAPATIAPCSTVSVVFTSTVNMFNAALNYNITAYTELATDQRRNSSDTVYFNGFNVQAAPISPSNQTQFICGQGSKRVGVALNPGDRAFWYRSNTALNPFSISDSITTPFLSTDTTYYVETFRATKSQVPATYVAPSGYVGFANATTSGTYFNIIAKTNMVIDSFEFIPREPVNYSGNFTVYYKSGSYVGFEQSASAWTTAGSQLVSSAGNGVLTKLRVGGIKMNAGDTFGFLIHGTTFSMLFKSGTETTNYSDLVFFSNTVIGGGTAFAGTVLNNFSFCGVVHYSKPCISNRVSVTLDVEPLPNSRLSAGAPFKGTFSGISSLTPDVTRAGDSIVYELAAPAGYTNADFGTGWNVSSFLFNTLGGFAPSDTFTVLPSSASVGKIGFVPTTAMTDSTFEIEIKVQNAAGCDSLLKRRIFVAPTPKPEFSNSNPCSRQSVQFTNNSTISSGYMSYLWSFGDALGTTSNQKDPQFTYLTPGNYSVKLIVTSDYGYKDSIVKTITVYPSPNVNYSQSTSCEGDSTFFTNRSTIATGTIASYHWAFGNNTTSTAINPRVIYSVAQGYNVWLTSVSDNNCRDSLMKVVYVFPRPVADFSSANVCKGTPAAFTNGSTIASGSLGYNWTFGDGNSSHNVNPMHSFSNTGTFSVKLKVYSGVGCLDSITKQVTVADKPLANFTTGLACDNDSVSFTDATTFAGTGMTQVWNFGDGNTRNTNGSVKHFYNAAGTYTATLTATAGNCSDVKTVSVEVKEAPEASFTSSGSICVNTPFSFTNTSSEPSATTYQWSFGNSTGSTSKNPSATYTTPGTVTVTLVATANGCADTEAKSYSVNALPVVSFNTNNLSGLRQVEFVPSNTTYYDYEWNMDDGTILNQVSPVYTFLSNGPFNVKLKVTDINGCVGDATPKVVAFNVSNGKELIGQNAINVFPNPFKGTTNINFTLARNANVKVVVYDMLGKELTTLINNSLEAGSHTTQLNSSALQSNAGMYLVKVEVNGEVYTKQIVEVK